MDEFTEADRLFYKKYSAILDRMDHHIIIADRILIISHIALFIFYLALFRFVVSENIIGPFYKHVIERFHDLSPLFIKAFNALLL